MKRTILTYCFAILALQSLSLFTHAQDRPLR